MRLSILIVHWNTGDDLRACLHSLQQNPFTLGATETIVVDNASTDGSPESVRRLFPNVRLIVNAVNENYARGTNQALDAATGDFLLLLNPDTEVLPDALNALVTFLQARPAFGAVAARLLEPSPPTPLPTCGEREVKGEAPLSLLGGKGGKAGGVPALRTQPSIRGFPEPRAVLYEMLGLARLFPKNRRFGAYRQTFFDYETAGEAPQPMASCFLISRVAYETVGAMDEQFPLFFNDVDWCLRCWRAGLKIGYTPDASVIHKGGGTTQKIRKTAIWESRRAWLCFNEKHYRATTPGYLYRLVNALLTLDAWRQTGRWGEPLRAKNGETTAERLRKEIDEYTTSTSPV